MTNKTQAQYLDLVTPGMLRAAQLRSELGAYAASKLSGAYDLITELYGVMHAAADPVPPAGGDVEVLGYSVKGNRYAIRLTKAELLDLYEGYTGDALVELVDRAHVTRLQAEVERLHGRVREEQTYVSELAAEHTALQSELTKARELNSAAADELQQANVRVILAEEQLAQYQCRHEWIDNGEDLLVCPKCGKEDSDPEPFGWVQTSGPSINRFTQEWDVVEEWSDNGYEWVELFTTEANQSAPADKGQGEPVATLARKYDDTLMPFVALMRKELHANADKGDRPGWLSMSADTCLLEIIYHFGKLQASVKRGDGDGMAEYGADVANMCMMLLDICGVINLVQHTEQPAPVAVVMPEHRDSDLRSPVYGYARGWNACLDELARLNPIKQ